MAAKRVVISGYYGFDNTGDEAVLHSILGALKQECKGIGLDITVLSNQPEKTSKFYGVKAIDRWAMKDVYKTIKNCDLLISGGGSLLQDVTSNKTIPYYLLIIKMAQWHKKEVVFYSQGYGPVNKGYNEFLIKNVLNKVNYIFVRDINSKKALLGIGVKNAPIIVAADPVLGMEASKEAKLKMKAYIKEHSNGKPRIGIYLRSWHNDQKLILKMRALCELLDKEGLEMFFIPMQEPEDYAFLKAIDFPGLAIQKVEEKLGIQEVFALTGEMDMVIGMRLHSLIMATAQGIPMVGLSYDPKVDYFLVSIDSQNCFDVETFDPQIVGNNVISQMANIEKEKENLQDKKQLLMAKVYQPAKLINKILT